MINKSAEIKNSVDKAVPRKGAWMPLIPRAGYFADNAKMWFYPMLFPFFPRIQGRYSAVPPWCQRMPKDVSRYRHLYQRYQLISVISTCRLGHQLILGLYFSLPYIQEYRLSLLISAYPQGYQVIFSVITLSSWISAYLRGYHCILREINLLSMIWAGPQGYQTVLKDVKCTLQ